MINLAPYFNGDEKRVADVLHCISALRNDDNVKNFMVLIEKLRDAAREENDTEYHKVDFRLNQGRIQALNTILFLFENCNEMLEAMSTRDETIKRQERS